MSNEIVGHGGCAQVRKVRSKANNQLYTVKLSHGSSNEENNRLLNEALVRRGLENEHLVMLIDLIRHTDGRNYMVMEFMDSGNLTQFI